MLNKGVSTPSKKSVGKILTTFWQTGRSMVEILCVLGVIGVLSLVSFVAIRSGLAKAQVNKIAYTVNLQANALLMALEADKLPIDENGDVTLSYNKTENGFALTGFSNDDGTFGLTVHGIPKDVCQQAGQNIPEQVFGMIINAEDEENQIPVGGQVKVGGVCVDTENTLTYYFAQLSVDPAEALSDYLCAELDEECGQCQTCQNGQCVLVPAGTTDPSGTCPETKPLCSATGTCICSNEHKSCGEGKVCDAANNTCKDCPSGSTTKTLASDLCDACGNTFRKGSTCYSCDYPTSPIVGSSTEAKNTCNSCPNRYWRVYSAGNEVCILQKCPTVSGGTSSGTVEFCSKCEEKTGIPTFGGGGTCYACDYPNSPIVGSSTEAKNLCNACPSRFWWSYSAGNEQCILNRCPTSEGTSNGSRTFCGTCAEKTGIAAFGSGNTCYACDYSSSVIVGSSTEAKDSCNACPNRFWWSYGAGNERCILNKCPTSGNKSSGSRTFCGTCAEETGIPAFGSGDTCYACDYSESVIVGSSTEAKNLCNACPSRFWWSYGAGNERCILNRCPTSGNKSSGSRTFCGTCAEETGIPAFGSGDTCYACDYSGSVIVGSSTEAKNLCNACPNRQWRSYGAGNEQCILK